VLTIFVGACLLFPNASRAATIETGWWWRANTGSSPETPAVPVVPAPQVTLPADPPAPPNPPNTDGGLQVAALPDGALAVAAVRVDQELTSLTLRVAPNGDANGDQAKLVACAAATPWKPAAGGKWADKPVVACDLINGGGSVAGVRATDGSWTFPVAPIADNGKTDVVSVPLADSDLASGTAVPFQLVFVPPTAADIVAKPTVTDDATGATDEGTGNELFSDPQQYEALTGSSFTNSGSASPVVRPALGDNEQAPVLPALAATENDSAAQTVGAVLVLLGIGALLWAARQPTPAVVSLVRNGREAPGVPPQVGGLGRFARERTGKPPSLQ
jgi:hypothetical protein